MCLQRWYSPTAGCRSSGGGSSLPQHSETSYAKGHRHGFVPVRLAAVAIAFLVACAPGGAVNWWRQQCADACSARHAAAALQHMLPCSTAGAVDRASWLAQPAGLCQAAYGSVTFLQKVWVCKSHPAPAVRALVCLVGFHMTCRCASLVQPIFIVNI